MPNNHHLLTSWANYTSADSDRRLRCTLALCISDLIPSVATVHPASPPMSPRAKPPASTRCLHRPPRLRRASDHHLIAAPVVSHILSPPSSAAPPRTSANSQPPQPITATATSTIHSLHRSQPTFTAVAIHHRSSTVHSRQHCLQPAPQHGVRTRVPLATISTVHTATTCLHSRHHHQSSIHSLHCSQPAPQHGVRTRVPLTTVTTIQSHSLHSLTCHHGTSV